MALSNMGDKCAPRYTRKRAKKALKMVKAAKMADMSVVDFAHKPYRYRHGWIKLIEDKIKGSPDTGVDKVKGRGGKMVPDPVASDPRNSHVKAGFVQGKDMQDMVSRNKAYKAKQRVARGPMPSQAEFDRVAKDVREAKAAREAGKPKVTSTPEQQAASAYYAAVRKYGRDSKQATKALRMWHSEAIRSGTVQTLSNEQTEVVDFATGFGRFNARRKARPPRPATFQKAPGTEKTPYTQQQLQNRASLKGHFRAKAIIAAQNGNMKAAKRFEQMRQVAKAARAQHVVVKSHAQMPKAPQPPKPHPAAVVHPTAPKPPATPRPFKPRKPRGPR